ncbi:MAG TPA: zinc-dependent alcohol dehydrogenase family protein [Burkholderiales bacterium]|nr:zinc-dependent alcohol dehydrogenase family protein [Burkholderiales bacterium]
MYGMQLRCPGQPLERLERAVPEPGVGQVLVRVRACGVCRTDLHLVDGELTGGTLPMIPGHEIVGTVAAVGAGVERFREGDRVGVPWLGWSCGSCRYCRRGQENLCDHARFTGFHIEGGYAEYALADARYCFPLPAQFDDLHAAPLLCAGLIGYRALAKAGDARRLGIYGFGAAAHIVAQLARHEGREVYAFTRPGDRAAQQFARELGAAWAGDSAQHPPEPLDAAIIFAPVGALVPAALRATAKGGRVICAGIHMSEIPAFPYDILWGERDLASVANLTRADGEAFLRIAPRAGVHTEIEPLPLVQANEALSRLRRGEVRGAFVLIP